MDKKSRANYKKPIPSELKTVIQWPGPSPLRASLLRPEITEAQKKAHSQLADEADRKTVQFLMHKIPILALYLEVDTKLPGWETSLIIKLARQQYSGFKIQFTPSKRRPKVWDHTRYLQLIADVEVIKRAALSKGLSRRPNDRDACSQLIKLAIKTRTGPYLPDKKTTAEKAAKTLENRLGEARNPKFNFMAKILQASDDAQYEAYMLDSLVRVFCNPGN